MDEEILRTQKEMVMLLAILVKRGALQAKVIQEMGIPPLKGEGRRAKRAGVGFCAVAPTRRSQLLAAALPRKRGRDKKETLCCLTIESGNERASGVLALPLPVKRGEGRFFNT